MVGREKSVPLVEVAIFRGLFQGPGPWANELRANVSELRANASELVANGVTSQFFMNPNYLF